MASPPQNPVESHYASRSLVEVVLAALDAAGLPPRLTAADLAPLDQFHARGLVEFVATHEGCSHAVVLEQVARPARILGDDEVHRFERFQGAQSDITQIADGRTHEIKTGFHDLLCCPLEATDLRDYGMAR